MSQPFRIAVILLALLGALPAAAQQSAVDVWETLLRPHHFPDTEIIEDSTVIEFAPGDCRFSVSVAPHVRRIVGIDISDQSGHLETRPDAPLPAAQTRAFAGVADDCEAIR